MPNEVVTTATVRMFVRMFSPFIREVRGRGGNLLPNQDQPSRFPREKYSRADARRSVPPQRRESASGGPRLLARGGRPEGHRPGALRIPDEPASPVQVRVSAGVGEREQEKGPPCLDAGQVIGPQGKAGER